MYQWYILIATMTSLGKSALLTNLFSLNLFIKLHCEEKKKKSKYYEPKKFSLKRERTYVYLIHIII